MIGFRLTEAERSFRENVRSFLSAHVTPDVVSFQESSFASSPARRAFMREVGRRGWIGLSWPREYGGAGLSGMYDYVLNEELAYVGAPQIGKLAGLIGRTLIAHGSPFLRERFLPRIRAGELEFALGYTEPEAGSDLASLRLPAVREGDCYRISGRKRFTSFAENADYIWLAARTSQGPKKQDGISLILVDTRTPGITVEPLISMAGTRTNDVIFDDVAVEARYLVGNEGEGWQYVSEALAFERYTMFPLSPIRRRFELLRDWACGTGPEGRRPIDDPVVADRMGDLAAELEYVQSLGYQVVALSNQGKIPVVEAAMHKLASTEYEQRLANTALDLMGLDGTVRGVGGIQDGLFEYEYRGSVIRTIGAGASEIQRTIIARRGLGLPAR